MFEPNDLKKGTVFKWKDNPVLVLEYSHTHKGRGSATVTAKIRDLITGSVQTLNFKAGDKLKEADLQRRSATFLYSDEESAHFMDSATYDELSLARKKIEEKLHFVKEGLEVTVLEFEGGAIDITLPPKVELKVIQTEPGVRGNTAAGAVYKPATLETGYAINVPIFVKQDDMIRVNTETGEYVERVG